MCHYKVVTTDSQTLTPMPAVTHVCRVCGCAMEAIPRPEMIQTRSDGATRVIPASTAITCKNDGCTLKDYTFEAKTYRHEDLTVYGVKAVTR